MLKALLRNFSPQAPTVPAPAPPVAGEHPFFTQLMGRFFASLGAVQHDNFDRERFGVPPGVVVGCNPVEMHEGFRFIHAHIAQFAQAHALFDDEASRRLYEDLLLYRMLGHAYVRLPANTPQHWALREEAQNFQEGGDSEYGSNAFGSMKHFSVPFMGENIRVECWPYNVAWAFLLKQYYFNRAGVAIQAEPGDHLIDAGACFGETALGFAAAVGATGRVYAFDMIPLNLQLIRSNVQANPALAGRIEIVESALVEDPEANLYIHGAGPSSHVSEEPSEQKAPVTSLDEFVRRQNVPRVDFIKMDIEGAESGALRGAVQTLKRWRPKLAISLYHKPADLFDIPLYLDSLGLDYAFHLNHYTIHTEETVLYARPRA